MNIDNFKELMCSYGKQIDIEFNDKQLEQFYEYMNLLLEWNEKINLTAIVEPEEVILKHFIDSLTINKYIEKNKTIADVGTGAGFPGIPLKIYRPDLKVVLVDSLNKRINFLNDVIAKLDLKDIIDFEKKCQLNQERDIKYKQTSTGPHRDDFSFLIGDIDVRKFGSQGQQRTAALSLKLSEIELVKKISKDTPVLLLDDVLSELDSNRQNFLLNHIGEIQTIITCTGLDDFINNRFEINKIFKVVNGIVNSEN